MEILVKKGTSHEAQKQAHDCDRDGSVAVVGAVALTRRTSIR